MVKYLIIYFFLLSINAFTQETVVQFQWGSIAYIGVSNPLTICNKEVSCNFIVLQASRDEIVKDSIDKCKFFYKPMKLGSDTIKIFKNGSSDSLIYLQSQIVNVIDWPLEPFILGSKGNKIEKKYLNNLPKQFKAYKTFSILDFKNQIDSFDVCIKRNNKIIFANHYNMKENLDELYKVFDSLQNGDEIIFFEIYYTIMITIHKAPDLKLIIE